ncbi:hypothetical protein Tco_0315849 [Tanacetum coccineum]
MARLQLNKFNEDRVKVLLVRELREMLQVQGEIMQLVKQGLLSVITVRAQESGQVLNEEQLAFLADPGITDFHDVHPTIIHNAAFQTDDLDAYDSDCDDISSAKAVLMANLSSYDSDVLSEVPYSDTYQHEVINQSALEMPYFEETPIVDSLDNEITSDSNIISYSQYLQESQQVVVQDTNSTTPNAITEGSWGFEHTKKVFKEEVIPFINSLRASFKDFENGLHNELNEVKTMFNQMEAAVEQCSVDKKYFDIQKKEVFLDNDRLLDHIICQDVMNIVMHADSILAKVLLANNKCLVNDNLEIERLEQENDHLFELLLSQDIVYICVNSLASRNDCREMQQGFIDE